MKHLLDAFDPLWFLSLSSLSLALLSLPPPLHSLSITLSSLPSLLLSLSLLSPPFFSLSLPLDSLSISFYLSPPLSLSLSSSGVGWVLVWQVVRRLCG